MTEINYQRQYEVLVGKILAAWDRLTDGDDEAEIDGADAINELAELVRQVQD
jgi:hypothetical protein